MDSNIITITIPVGVIIGKLCKETRDYIILKDAIKLDEFNDKMIPPFDVLVTKEVKYFKKKIESTSDNIGKETLALYNDLLTTFYGE